MKDDTYLENMLTIARLASQKELALIHESNIFMIDTLWRVRQPTLPTEVNAVYTNIINHITVPVGILQFPFYNLGLEYDRLVGFILSTTIPCSIYFYRALNYGAIGAIVGHELTHGFDNSGRLFNINGNLLQWWTNDTIIEYEDKVECFIEHYGSYYEEEVDQHVDGELTLDENIADNGGLREAVYAYQKWKTKHAQEPLLPGFSHLSHDQLLYLGFAHVWCEAHTPESLRWILRDSHSPGHVRLRAVLKNSKEFSKAWKCPVGSPMNPNKKCRIW